MDIEEARKILGPKYDVLPDYQILGLIELFSSFSRLMLDEYRKDPKALSKKIKDIKKARK